MHTCNCRPTVVVQVNESIMLLIVTDRETDYIFVTDFDEFSEHLDSIINQACRTVSTTPSTSVTLTPTTTPLHTEESTTQPLSTLQFLHTFFGCMWFVNTSILHCSRCSS